MRGWGPGEGEPGPLESAGLSVEQKLSGSHKALVEMQDLVAELLRTVPREDPATKVRGLWGPWSRRDPFCHHQSGARRGRCSGCLLPGVRPGGPALLLPLAILARGPEGFGRVSQCRHTRTHRATSSLFRVVWTRVCPLKHWERFLGLRVLLKMDF